MKKLLFFICLLITVLLAGCSKDDFLNDGEGGNLDDESGLIPLICGDSPFDANPDCGILSDIDTIVCWGTDRCWQIMDDSNEPWNEAACRREIEAGNKWISRRGLWDIWFGGTFNSAYRKDCNKDKYEEICLTIGARIDNGDSEVLAHLRPNLWPNGQILAIPNFIYMPGIVGIDVITEQDFDVNHPAGSSLADIAYAWYSEYDYLLVPNGEQLNREQMLERSRQRVPMQKLDISRVKILESLQVEIAGKPQCAGTYILKQVVYLSNGKQLSCRFWQYWLEEDLK